MGKVFPALVGGGLLLFCSSLSMAQTPVLTQGYDSSRDGLDATETTLTPANVNSNSFGKLLSLSVDGKVYAQPLYVPNVAVSGQSTTRNVVFVATMHDSVYAFDADGLSIQPYWHTSFINPSAGVTTEPVSDNGGNTDTDGEIGIMGTPVIDSSTGTLYVIAKTDETSGKTTTPCFRLHALNITNGAELTGSPTACIQASVVGTGTPNQSGSVLFSSLYTLQRPGLALNGVDVYAAFGSWGDTPPWHGWVLAFDKTTLQIVATYNSTPNGSEGEGGVWASGRGLAVDASGSLFIPTGNGNFDGATNYGDSYVKVSPSLGVLDYFTPYDQQALDSGDLDISSSGVTLLPDSAGTTQHPQILIGCGKNGTIYVVDRNNLGQFRSSGDTQIIQEIYNQVGGTTINPNSSTYVENCYSGAAYWNGNVYFGGILDSIKQFKFTNGLVSTPAASHSPEVFQFPGGFPVISANGTTNGILWTIDNTGSTDPGRAGTAVLRAYDATNLATELYNSTQSGSDAAGAEVKFALPTVANGKVYVGTQSTVAVYGLLSSLPQAAAPVYNPPAGSYSGATSISISNTSPGTTIFYTTDGTTPTESSSVYSGPILLSNSATVSAIAVGGGYRTSPVAVATYVIAGTVPISFAQVAAATPQGPNTTVSVTYPAAETPGDMNIVVVGWNDTTSAVQSVTDSAGNTYKLAIGPTSGTALQQSIYYAANVAGVSDTVTVTFNQAATAPDIRILEYRGVNTLDVTAGASGSGGAASSGAATTSGGNELIFGANTVSTGNAAAGAGFTARIITNPDSDLAEDQVASAAGSFSATATLTSSGFWVMQMAAFSNVINPTVSSVSPNSGPTNGGTAVTITGTNFASGATVTFGSTAATNVTVVNSTTITATTPAGSVGAATVSVTDSNGLAGSLAGGFTYAGVPTVTGVSPNSGSNLGGTAVSIAGTNFAPGATVTFGSAAATNVTVVNSTTITATTPAGIAGSAVTVTVTNVGSQSGSLASSFTYTQTTMVTPPGSFIAAMSGTSTPVYVSGQQYYNATAQTSHTTSAFNSTGANLLLIFVGCHNNTVFTITDSFGNTWLPLVGPSSSLGSQTFPLEGEFFYVPNAKTGANHTITVALSQSEPLIMSIAAVSGDNTYSPIDAYSAISSDNGTLSSNIYSSPLTTYQINDLLFGIVKGNHGKTFTAGPGYVNQSASTGLNFAAETGAAPTTGPYTTNFTASQQDYWQSSLTAIAPAPTQTTMSWTAAVGGPITSYFVERCAGVGCSSFTQIASLGGSALSYTDTSISSGTTYGYRVRAENSAAMFSAYSAVQTVSPIVPSVVSNLTASTLKSLSWNAAAETGGSISQYSVERCAGSGCSNFSLISTTASTSYVDASATAGTTYNYRVRAQDANGLYGPYSEVFLADIPAYLDNATAGGNNGGSTASLSYSFTVGTNSNRLLLVNLVGDTSADDITSVTYGGTSLSLSNKIQTPSGRWHYLYYLLSPTSGTNNVVITAASSHYLISEASSWFNIAQLNQPQTSATNTAAATAEVLTATLPASANTAIVVESMWAPNEILPGNGSTEIVADAATQTLGMFSSSVSPVTSAYPVSMTNTWGGEQPASSITASFLLASNGTAGISFDNAADGGNNGGSTTSLSYAYTVGTGANRLLIVNLIGSTSVDDISSVTYAGSPMTLLGKLQAASNAWQYVYYLLNPAGGTNNVVINSASAHSLVSQAASWYNVNQSSQPDALVTNTTAAGATSMTTSLNVNTPGSLVVQGVWSSAHLAAGQGSTPVVVDSASDSTGIFVSTSSPAAAAGSASMTTISDGTLSSGVVMASFAP